jgi:hypothetical protein
MMVSGCVWLASKMTHLRTSASKAITTTLKRMMLFFEGGHDRMIDLERDETRHAEDT